MPTMAQWGSKKWAVSSKQVVALEGLAFSYEQVADENASTEDKKTTNERGTELFPTLLRSNNMDNLQLRQRIVRSMIRVSERTANMRKPEKFEYRKHMTAAFMDMLELCIEANRARGSRRAELQNKMDTKLDVLRSLVDTAVSPEDRLISPGLHEIWSKELNEIGRMLGGWKKSNE